MKKTILVGAIALMAMSSAHAKPRRFLLCISPHNSLSGVYTLFRLFDADIGDVPGGRPLALWKYSFTHPWPTNLGNFEKTSFSTPDMSSLRDLLHGRWECGGGPGELFCGRGLCNRYAEANDSELPEVYQSQEYIEERNRIAAQEAAIDETERAHREEIINYRRMIRILAERANVVLPPEFSEDQD